MAAARKSKKPAKKPAPAKKKATPKRKAAGRPSTPPGANGPHLLPVPDSRATALAWFANLSSRIFHAGVPELQTLIAEARTYDLVGLGHALGDDSQVLALNKAANELIEAGLDTFGSASPQGFQLQVLRDILNDS
jgi:hypothetical protein